MVAIARYPYLKAEGKGAFHKASMRLPQDLLIGIITALLLHGLHGWLYPNQTLGALMMFPAGVIVAVTTAAWFNRRLGGHTGDSYGAVVEWIRGFAISASRFGFRHRYRMSRSQGSFAFNDGFGFIQG